jgi:NhaP-type Na+/H+ or K+/H+ antiporter
LHWWEFALAALPLFLAVSQVGYLASKPFHAAFGIVLGLVVGTAGFWLNVQLAHRPWRRLLEIAAMLIVLVGCFVVVEAIAFILNAMLPAGFFDR